MGLEAFSGKFSSPGTLRVPLVIGTLAYKLQMVAAWAVGVMGSKEFRLYPSTTVSE